MEIVLLICMVAIYILSLWAINYRMNVKIMKSRIEHFEETIRIKDERLNEIIVDYNVLDAQLDTFVNNLGKQNKQHQLLLSFYINQLQKEKSIEEEDYKGAQYYTEIISSLKDKIGITVN